MTTNNVTKDNVITDARKQASVRDKFSNVSEQTDIPKIIYVTKSTNSLYVSHSQSHRELPPSITQ